jgi:hypothetical protein
MQLTISDLDKIDTLNDEVIAAIKASKFTAEFEVYLRTEFSAFVGQIAEDYNAIQPVCK